MALINEHFLKLQNNYLFSDIAKKVNSFKVTHPKKKIIRMGIGDVTQPLAPAVIEAMHKAVDEMASKDTFHGYGPEQGYPFLIDAIIKNDYASRGIFLEPGEVFVSDGAKSDCGNIGDMLRHDNSIGVTDPVYPVYVDTNIMAGRKIVYANANEENDFLPMPDSSVHADIIYICSPNNPTGAVYTKEQLEKWVAYALEQNAVILFDSAYESFVRDDSLPTSIYAVEGAKKCAIEFCSFSKTAGFTGTRCGYTVVPNELEFGGVKLNKLWLRRQTTKFNGVPYIIQKGAAAVFTPEGQKQIRANIDYYMENARLVSETLNKMGIWHTGGKNSPYIWLKCPNGMKSWEYFDYLLEKAHVVGTPGAGFGVNGEGFFRLTAFNSRENVLEAVERIKKTL